MLPIRDINPARSTPWVNYALLVANILAFLLEWGLLRVGMPWNEWAFVPARFALDPLGQVPTVLAAMFMHAGWGHLIGNLLFLWIFGDNVEDAMGHLRYFGFYVVAGVGATLAQFIVDPSTTVPLLGASGAIAGVLGAYLVLYPRAPVVVLNPVILLWLLFGPFLRLPAFLVIGLWFFQNLWSGIGELGRMELGGQSMTAFFAHIGGFLVGLLLVRALSQRQSPVRRPHRDGWQSPPPRHPVRSISRAGWGPERLLLVRRLSGPTR